MTTRYLPATEADVYYAESFSDQTRLKKLPENIDWVKAPEYPVSSLLFFFKTKRAAQDWLEQEKAMRTELGHDDSYYEDMEAWVLSGDDIEEIVLLEDQNGKPIDLWDGWHRAAIAVANDVTSLPAIVGRVPVTTSTQANVQHSTLPHEVEPMSSVDNLISQAFSICAAADMLVSAAKVDDLKAKHPDIAEDIQKLHDNDPTSQKKYLPWGTKRLLDGDKALDIVEAITKFERLSRRMEKRDIFQYKSLAELQEAIADAERPTSESKQKKIIVRDGSEYLYNDDEFLLVHPNIKKASCHYGMGTVWCVSQAEANWYEKYEKENCYLYFLIDKTKEDESKKLAADSDPWAKVAFRFCKDEPHPVEIRDRRNNPLTVGKVLNYFRERGEKTADKVWRLMGLCFKHAHEHDDTTLYKLDRGNLDSEEAQKIFDEHKDDIEVKRLIAKNKSTPLPILEALSSDSDKSVREALTQNTNLPRELWFKLLRDEQPTVRLDAIHNAIDSVNEDDEDSIVEFIRAYAEHPMDSSIRTMRWLLDQRATPTDVLLQFAAFKPMAYQVLQHKNADEAVARLVLGQGDHDFYTISLAIEKANLTEDEQLSLADLSLADKNELAAQALARKSSSSSVLEKLAKHDVGSVRVEVATSKYTPPEVLAQLAADDASYVRKAALSNDNITTEALAALAERGADDLGFLVTEILNHNKAAPELSRSIAHKVVESISGDMSNAGWSLREHIINALERGIFSDEDATKLFTSTTASQLKRNVLETILLNKAYKQETRDKVFDIGLSLGMGVSGSILSQLSEPEKLQRLWGLITTKTPHYAPDVSYVSPLIANKNTPGTVLADIVIRKVTPHRSDAEGFYTSLFNHPNFPLDALVNTVATTTSGTALGKAARKALEQRPDKPAKVRKPRTSKAVVTEPVAARVDALADKLHQQKRSLAVILAVEQAANALAVVRK